jgi:hypothetical protein
MNPTNNYTIERITVGETRTLPFRFDKTCRGTCNFHMEWDVTQVIVAGKTG